MVLGMSLTALNEISSVLNKLLSTGTVVTKIRLSRIDMIPLYYFFMKLSKYNEKVYTKGTVYMEF